VAHKHVPDTATVDDDALALLATEGKMDDAFAGDSEWLHAATALRCIMQLGLALCLALAVGVLAFVLHPGTLLAATAPKAAAAGPAVNCIPTSAAPAAAAAAAQGLYQSAAPAVPLMQAPGM
jgi:hypothetical protein